MRTRVIVVLLFLAAAWVPVARADRAEEMPLRSSFALFPMDLGEWQGQQQPPFTDKVLAVLGLDDYLTRWYTRGKRGADLYIGFWKSQRQGDTIHSPQNCLPGAGWEPISQRLLTFADPRQPGGEPLAVNRIVIQKGLQKQLVLYWYQSRGRVVGSEYWSKIYLVFDAARYNRTDAALVRIVIPFAGGADAEAATEKEALDFVNVLMPQLGNFLPELTS